MVCCRDATANTFVTEVQGEVFVRFHAVLHHSFPQFFCSSEKEKGIRSWYET
jgi:hypothetical protein